jgi:hypothetical protein
MATSGDFAHAEDLPSSPASLGFDSRRHIGFLAQDVAKVVPEAVAEMHGDRFLGVDYAALVPVLVGAIQELDATVARQGLTIAALERKVAALIEKFEGVLA